MFSAIRRQMHVSPATVIATLALVFAMTGGAYAASKVFNHLDKADQPEGVEGAYG